MTQNTPSIHLFILFISRSYKIFRKTESLLRKFVDELKMSLMNRWVDGASTPSRSLWFSRAKQQYVDSKDVSSVYFIAQQFYDRKAIDNKGLSVELFRLAQVSSKTLLPGVDHISRVSCALRARYTRKPCTLRGAPCS